VEELTTKLGLLLETAEAQQRLAATHLEQLREHTRGLDAIVREEIRSTLIEELQGLADYTGRAGESLRSLERVVNLKLAACSAAVTAVCAATPLALAWWTLPSRADVAALRAAHDELTANIARLAQHGGRVQLRRCGTSQRLCVRVDRTAPQYGEGADYLVVKGY
jgi:hypothetical protein